MSFSSPMPRGARLTSGFGNRGGVLHAGTDFAGQRPGMTNVKVTNIHRGTVIATGYGYGRASDRIPYHSGRFALVDMGVMGGDRMYAYYGHLASLNVSAGQTISAGHVIGIMGGSGSSGENHFAIHLHLGIAQNTSRPVNAARRAGAPGWINPVPWLQSKGIRVGSSSPVSPSSGSGSSSGGGKSSSHAVPNATLTQRMDRMGYNRQRWITDRVRNYQRAQLFGGLVADGHWGPVTEGHYDWVLRLQRALNQWRGNDIAVDGDYRTQTRNRVRNVQQRNQGGAYRGAVDGIPGPVTCRMLGIPTHPSA